MLPPEMTIEEGRAWKLYCEETAGSMDVRDFWHELPSSLQMVYLSKVRHARIVEIRNTHGDNKKELLKLRGSTATLTIT